VHGLKRPFALGEDAVRKGETPFHRAIREATVNSLIHAAYRAGGSIVIERRRDAFIFQNPGRFLTPIDRIISARDVAEGLSDPRNPLLLGMFYIVGLAERRGTGYPTIFSAWDEGKRHSPTIVEDTERNLTKVTLPLLSQISPEMEADLRRFVGPQYALLSGLDKDILIHAYQFGETSNAAIQFSSREHPKVIGDRLKYLADCGWLVRHGSAGRGRTYGFNSRRAQLPLDPVDGGAMGDGAAPIVGIPTTHKRPKPYSQQELSELAASVRNKQRATRREMEAVIIELCRNEFRTARELADMVGRKQKMIQENYLRPMTKDGRLQRLYREPGHPEQAYITSETA
jgi:ATP-dependent DNA helicase RecG